MKQTMIDLWRGEDIVSREGKYDHKRVMQLVKELGAQGQILQAQLDDKGKEVLEALQDTHGAIASLESEGAFVRGLTLGLRLMAEAFAE